MATKSNVGLEELTTTVLQVFPTLDPLEQRLSLELYRLLAEGNPVPRAALAEGMDVPIETVDRILDRWPGVFSDPQRRVIGYWGLAIPAAYASPHKLTVGGRTLSAWCAWDTLFLPRLLDQTVEVESTSPDADGTVRLTVSPDRVERAEPAGTMMSFLLPGAAGVERDIVTTFCHFVHFFPSRDTGERWVGQHGGTFLLSIDEAHELARRKNAAQYGDVLK